VRSSRILTCFASLPLAFFAAAQTTPTNYTIVEGINGGASPGTTTIYRSGDKVLMEFNQPANGSTPAIHSRTLYDLAAHTDRSWDPTANPVVCNAGSFTDDWGDPFGMTSEFTDGIKKGELKPAGNELMAGVATSVFTGSTGGSTINAWFDQKDGLVVKAVATTAGGQSMTMADVRRITMTAPAASLFALPASCAGTKPPLSAAETIADETGDSDTNFVNAIYGPGSKNNCTIALHVVQAKTMAPITRKFQVAIDTTYDQNNPVAPHYTFGLGNDGTSTFSGGGIHEITSQIHNGVLRIVNPPAYFNLSLNVVTPGHGTGTGLIYRQCFAPVTNLYHVMTDQADPSKPDDYLYAKAGKYAAVP
jgi:hypothetical protein